MLTTNLKLKVSTGKKEFSIKWNESEKLLLVETTSYPEKGKANKEILKNLKRFFGAETVLVSGFSGKEKIIQIAEDEKRIFETLKNCTNTN